MRRICIFSLNICILFGPSINTLMAKIFDRDVFMERYEFPPQINLEFVKGQYAGTVQQLENEITNLKDELYLNINSCERFTRSGDSLYYYQRAGRKLRYTE